MNRTTPQSLKRHTLNSRARDLTDLDEKVEGRNLNLESNTPKGQFTPVSFPTLARYAEIYAWVAAEHHPWKDLRNGLERTPT